MIQSIIGNVHVLSCVCLYFYNWQPEPHWLFYFLFYFFKGWGVLANQPTVHSWRVSRGKGLCWCWWQVKCDSANVTYDMWLEKCKIWSNLSCNLRKIVPSCYNSHNSRKFVSFLWKICFPIYGFYICFIFNFITRKLIQTLLSFCCWSSRYNCFDEVNVSSAKRKKVRRMLPR